MAPSVWEFMKRSKSTSRPQSKLQKMAPGLVIDSERRGSGSTLEVTSPNANEDYSSFMSDVLVVGAGPAGLMLA
jgi:phenol 2-monooxygenase